MADWRSELDGLLRQKQSQREEQAKGDDATRFMSGTAVPALEDLRAELEKHGREVTIRASGSSVALFVSRGGEEELMYRIQFRSYPDRVLPYVEIRGRERKGLKLVSTDSMFRSGKPDYRLSDITREEIIKHFLDHYRRRVHSA